MKVKKQLLHTFEYEKEMDKIPFAKSRLIGAAIPECTMANTEVLPAKKNDSEIYHVPLTFLSDSF